MENVENALMEDLWNQAGCTEGINNFSSVISILPKGWYKGLMFFVFL